MTMFAPSVWRCCLSARWRGRMWSQRCQHDASGVSVSRTFSDMVLTMMMQLARSRRRAAAVDIATLDAATRGS
ncbi:MAG: hypothetical protein ACLS7Z_08005 [Christensenellales bacterium]